MSNPHPDPLADMLTEPHELDGKFEPQAKTVTTCISDAAEFQADLALVLQAVHRDASRDTHALLTKALMVMPPARLFVEKK